MKTLRLKAEITIYGGDTIVINPDALDHRMNTEGKYELIFTLNETDNDNLIKYYKDNEKYLIK
jgi:hypothetical protein